MDSKTHHKIETPTDFIYNLSLKLNSFNREEDVLNLLVEKLKAKFNVPFVIIFRTTVSGETFKIFKPANFEKEKTHNLLRSTLSDLLNKHFKLPPLYFDLFNQESLLSQNKNVDLFFQQLLTYKIYDNLKPILSSYSFSSFGFINDQRILGGVIFSNLKISGKQNKKLLEKFLHLITSHLKRCHLTEIINNSLTEKETLLKEIHHRVKNNFQVIISLLNLQGQKINDKILLTHFNDAKNRIRSMALIHEKLYQTREYSKVDLSDYISVISQDLHATYYHQSQNLDMIFDMEQIYIDIEKAIPCGLIINEVLTNSFKYAFPDFFNKTPEITIELHKINSSTIKLLISDNGVGIPNEFDIKNSNSLGMQLIPILTAQMKGTYQLISDQGTTWEFNF